MMGGSLSGGNITPAAEFNVYVDPEAARIVFQSGIPITMVGLDVTRRTSLTDKHVRVLEAAQNPVSQAAAKIARHAIDHNREQGFLVGPNMHDSLAVAAFLDPSILKWKEYYVDVETAGELTAGETLGYSPTAGDLRRRPDAEKQAPLNIPIRGSAPTLATTKTSPVLREKFVPNTKVAVEVDSANFFDLLIGRLASAASPGSLFSAAATLVSGPTVMSVTSLGYLRTIVRISSAAGSATGLIVGSGNTAPPSPFSPCA
jgi:inosine-uridine nucleoside N-ribohydrolase